MNVEHSELQNTVKKRHWLKRLGIAILIPILLMIVAVLLLKFLGSETTDAIDQFLNNVWWPLSLIRLALYIVIAFAVLPFFIRRASDKNQFKIKNLEHSFELSTNDYEKSHISYVLRKAKGQQVAFSHYLSKKVWVFIALLAPEFLMIQLPYFLRG